MASVEFETDTERRTLAHVGGVRNNLPVLAAALVQDPYAPISGDDAEGGTLGVLKDLEVKGFVKIDKKTDEIVVTDLGQKALQG